MSIARRVASRWLHVAAVPSSNPAQCKSCRGTGFGPGLIDCPACKGMGQLPGRDENISEALWVWDSYPSEPARYDMSRDPGDFEKAVKKAYRQYMKQVQGRDDDETDFLEDWDMEYREVLVNPDDPDSTVGIVSDDDGRIQGHFYFPKSDKYEDAARKMAEKDFADYEASQA